MNSGSFFRLDLETSKVVDGITYYNYIDLPELNDGEDKLRYPVRLSISSDNVSFLVHYFSNSDIPRHIEEVILRLPFGTNDIEALSSSIKRIYNTTFPLSSYLYDVLLDRYTNRNIDYDSIRNSQINKNSYSSLSIWGLIDKSIDNKWVIKLHNNDLDNRNKKIIRFLRKLLLDFMFDLMHSDVFEVSKYCGLMREGLMNDFFFSSIVRKSEYYYYRRLVRNKCCQLFENTKRNINEDLCRCVTELRVIEEKKNEKNKKGEEVANEIIEELNELRKMLAHKQEDRDFCKCGLKLMSLKRKKDKIITEEKQIEEEKERLREKYKIPYDVIMSVKYLYAEKLDNAERDWVNCIMNPLAEKHFSFTPEWYDNQDKHYKRDDLFRVSESWFVNPEEEMSRVMFPLPEIEVKTSRWRKFFQTIGIYSPNSVIHYLNSFELNNLIGSKDDSLISTRNTRVSKWFYHRFDFKDTFRLHLFNRVNIFFTLILWMFIIASILSAFFPGLWERPVYFASFPVLCFLLLFVSGCYFLYSSCRHNNPERLDDILLDIRRKRECKKSLYGAASFMCFAAFLFINGFEDAMIYHLGEWVDSMMLHLAAWVIWLIAIILLLGFNYKYRVVDNIHLLLPRLVASIAAAWIMIVIGNDIFKEYLSIPVWMIISFIVFVFVLYEINKALPNQKSRTIIFRAIELIGISYSIAVIVGIFAIDVLEPSILEVIQKTNDTNYIVSDSCTWHFLGNCNELKLTDSFDLAEEFKLTIYPRYLIPFSFLAMFIGVFIQMIFDEKNITEM